MLPIPALAWALVALCAAAEPSSSPVYSSSFGDPALSLFAKPDRPEDCPPCFNCNLKAFQCHQYSNCTAATGRCACPAGWGGDDCTTPLCGSLAGDNRPPRKGDTCECEEGWEGINCNVCNSNKVCNPLVPSGEDGVCYNGGLVVHENYQQCDVTNEKILRELKGKKPQVTFSCNNSTGDCNFQFWVDERESFYCGLDNCTAAVQTLSDRNITRYDCPTIRCKCVPGRMLCGEGGSLDLGEFLEDEIKGPASFSTTWMDGAGGATTSEFSEPNMDQLISDVFADDRIFLRCRSGECLHESEVPGNEKPEKVINTELIAVVIAACGLFILGVVVFLWYLSRRQARWGPIHLSDEEDQEAAKLIMDHKPAALYFRGVSYNLKGKQILYDVEGNVNPGEVMAIMGASGAGKTTFLDILARKNKRGSVEGEFYINGEKIADDDFKGIIGFVDQDDTLLPTLTVHETIVDSARLRLPKEMGDVAKLQRVEEVEKQLGIYHIRHQIIGSEEGSGRGISGGEKRRVGIACELVTSPSILFLDEPTSGLDAYNAFNVVECLVNLVKSYNRTVVMTIHQPRSNIVALFDQLVLLAQGHTVYSGPFASCQPHFDNIGFSCPPGFNIADYLIDLTMHAGTPHAPLDDEASMFSPASPQRPSSTAAQKSAPSTSIASGATDPAEASPIESPRPRARRKMSVRQQQERQLYSRRRDSADAEPPVSASRDESPPEQGEGQWLRLSTQRGGRPPRLPTTADDPDDTPAAATGATGTDLDLLTAKYRESDVRAGVRDELDAAIAAANAANGTNPDAATNGGADLHSRGFKGYEKVGLAGQFAILSVRTWRNLYRNPMLMLTHYAIAIVLAVFLGYLFYGVGDDIKGFQNRLGLFFFLLALFGFSTLTSLTVFAPERLVFVRERAKGYYQPVAYFAAKVIFDIVPLRLVPPLIMGAIVYPMAGLVERWEEFRYFILFLVLFNLAAAAICLFIGIVFRNGGVANLLGSLVMLFSLLFSGFLLNHESIPGFAQWLQKLSIFHYGFEGMIVNEVSSLRLSDHKYGVNIEVPGAAILSSFGFENSHVRLDAISLGVFCGVFLVLAYGAMHILLIERR